MGNPLIIEGLTVAYRSRSGSLNTILAEVDLRLEPGEVLGLAGESGCGKSTLALCATGYQARGSEVLAGRVKLGDVSLLDLTLAQRRAVWGKRIAMVAQSASGALNPGLTIGVHLEQTLRTHVSGDTASLRRQQIELLESVGLPDPDRALRRFPHEFSGGQQQRIAIALAIACRPDVLILDEPTTGLDVTTQAKITKLLQELFSRYEMAALYVSHDLPLLSTIADRLAVMYAGRIVESAPCRDLFSSPAHPYTRALLASAPGRDRRRLIGIQGGPPPGAVKDACAFAPRCTYAAPECTAGGVALKQIGCSHTARCKRLSEIPRTPAKKIPAPPSPSAVGAPLLTLSDMTCSYGTFKAVSGVNLSISPGEIVGIFGESGSGKTTLLRSVAGVVTPSAGQLLFDDRPLPGLSRRSQQQRKDIQLVFQDPNACLNPRHDAAAILARPLALFRPELADDPARARAIEELFDIVNLPRSVATRRPGQLSGGQKQRLSLARALAAKPRLLLCDEITSALDVSVQAVVVEVLRDLVARTGVAVVFVSHDLGVVRSLCDRAIVMQHGNIREAGDTETLFAHPRHDYTRTLLSAEPELPVEAFSEAVVAT